jgi:hypothetical protein
MPVRSREIARQLDDLSIALRELLGTTHDINAKVERLDATIVTRDPGNARSAEEFAGLRKTIVQASTQRRQHVSHLVSVLGDIDAGGSPELLRLRVTDFLAELGVVEASIEQFPEAFDPIDEAEAPLAAIVQDLGDGVATILRRGRAPLAEFRAEESNDAHHHSTGEQGASEVSPEPVSPQEFPLERLSNSEEK